MRIQSESGTYRLLLNETGNLEIWCASEMVWSKYTFDKYIELLYVGSDGLYFLGKDGSNRLIVPLNNLKQKVDFLLMRNDGNLVIFDDNGGIAWKSVPYKKCGTWYFSCFKINLLILMLLSKILFQ